MNLQTASNHESFARWTMESDAIVRVYESRFWRRSLLVATLTQLSFEQEFEMVSRAAKLKGNESLLDLACGTGIYARPFAKQLVQGVVFGLDLSKPMLNYASQQARNEGLTNMILLHGDALDIPLPDAMFDNVNCCGALHLFSDLDRVLREISRVLKPGGVFTFATFRQREGALAERIVRLRKNATGMNAFRPDELELRLNQAGFEEVKCHHAKGIWLVMGAIKQ